MAQSYNLHDVYAIQFAQVMSGLLARPDFPASTLTLAEFLDIVEPIAKGATRRLANTVGDMSTAVPPTTDYDAGWTGSSNLFEPPAAQAAPAPYVPPTSVSTPSGERVPYEQE
jgi:hypothetical protein